ncbi:MAG: cytochrome c [candidate division KSB1 bacterium]|nr:cytochrome c [candidate division KSB1 bacterium]MDZ7304909.1 cytochrome c [candidate division KSB1 bacterium]MDZ7313955.1 cytochrome c [candidate division KSB1 bacterium]
MKTRELLTKLLLFVGIFLMTMGSRIIHAQEAAIPDIAALAGRQLYALKKCGDCHNQGATKFTPIKAAPDSAKLAAHVEALKLENVLRKDTSPRRQKKTFGTEIQALVAYLKNRETTDATAKTFVTAGFVMTREGCRNCHAINGIGAEVAPNLKGVGSKHNKKWLIDHFVDPQAFVKDSDMPSFKNLPKAELEAMADYLLTIK